MKIELCVASIEALQIVKDLRIDRIELCQNLEQGGMTPSHGFIEMALLNEIETHVLIRPRAAGFTYSEDEIQLMLSDIKDCRELGVKGIVIGALNLNKTIDRDAMLRMKEVAKDLEITCHRAFDDSFDWKNSMDVLIEAGINRILSSGLSSSVELGLPILTEMMKYAKSRIEIMVGGGVNLGNVQRILLDVQPDAIHFSGTSKLILDENSYFSETLLQIDKSKVEKLIHSIRG
ncbi:MAG: copper homeostasis protein CutC [Crocinitomicaceae bacterium]|nr:copper homeostasis protein CutC [Crocinitomicaceae bacterium]